MRLREKLLLPTIAFVVLIVAALFLTIRGKTPEIERQRAGALAATANSIQNTIDRNLFERYGDVQAFALNTTAHRDLTTLDEAARRQIVRALDGYITGYGCYSLALVVDPQGTVVAVNSVDAQGRPLPRAAALLGAGMAGEEWFKAVRAGEFTTYEAPDALTGTYMQAPHRNRFVEEVYGARAPSWNMTFSAPIHDGEGQLRGYWHNVLASDAIEAIAAQSYRFLADQEIASAEITVLDREGRVIVDVDPSYRGSFAPFLDDVLSLNLATAGVALAEQAVDPQGSSTGTGRARHKRKSDELGKDFFQIGAYARSQPVMGFAGSGTATLVRATEDEVFAVVGSLMSRTLLVGGLVLALTIAVMAFLFHRLAQSVSAASGAIAQLARGELEAELPVVGNDEIAKLARRFNEACASMRDALQAEKVDWAQLAQQQKEAARLLNVVENAPINIMVADPEMTIRYLNPASRETLKKIEPFLPVKADGVVGSSIDIFHKDPSVQRKILADPRNLPHSAEFKIGTEIMNLQAAAIVDAKGAYLGPMVTWSIVTEERKREAREDRMNAQMRETLEKVMNHSHTVSSASEELSATARQMTEGTEEATRQAESAAVAGEEVSRNVATVATSAEEMNASIKEIARNSAEAARVATNAVRVTDSTNQTVRKLGESSNEIGEVIKVITSIAEQTNLLALNATIEAARAGEAGKGFAVVANEVKELAKQTAAATEDISAKIEAIQSDTSGAVIAIGEISEVIARINDIQTTIASAVEEQSVTTNEIARNASEAAQGSADITRNITTVSHLSRTSAEGASNTLTAASELAKLAADLRAIVEEGGAGGHSPVLNAPLRQTGLYS
ncbi:MAG: methyl-accepting chemotaxis protein [Opitutales bacterium]